MWRVGKERGHPKACGPGGGPEPGLPGVPRAARGTLNAKRRVTQPRGRAGRGVGARAAAARPVLAAAAGGAVSARASRADSGPGLWSAAGALGKWSDAKNRRGECGGGPGPGKCLCVGG